MRRHRVCELVAVCGEVIAGVRRASEHVGARLDDERSVGLRRPIAAVARLPAVLATEPGWVEPWTGDAVEIYLPALVEPLETVYVARLKHEAWELIDADPRPTRAAAGRDHEQGKDEERGPHRRDRSGVLFWGEPRQHQGRRDRARDRGGDRLGRARARAPSCGRSSSPSSSTSRARRCARRCAGSPRSASSRSCRTAACASHDLARGVAGGVHGPRRARGARDRGRGREDDAGGSRRARGGRAALRRALAGAPRARARGGRGARSWSTGCAQTTASTT